MSTRVLVIDDDVELTSLLSELFREEGFELEAHWEGAGAALKVAEGAYELIILDVMLPGMSGFEVLRQIRHVSLVPVILLTARGDDIDRVVGLEIGADDYLPKPFNARELMLRMRAVLRRSERRRPSVLKVDDIALDPLHRRVSCGGDWLELTNAEFDILRELLAAAGTTVTRETIASSVQGRALGPDDRSIDMHISNLRRKLRPRDSDDDRIKSVRGIGYIYTLPMNGES